MTRSLPSSGGLSHRGGSIHVGAEIERIAELREGDGRGRLIDGDQKRRQLAKQSGAIAGAGKVRRERRSMFGEHSAVERFLQRARISSVEIRRSGAHAQKRRRIE